MNNPFGFICNIFLRQSGARPTGVVMEMREVFGPDATFSIMAPVDWVDQSQAERLVINAPEGGPALVGSAWRVDEEVSLRSFAAARFAGVEDMRIYDQVEKEFILAKNDSLVREYQGRWPGDRKKTSYLVACLCAGSIRVSVTLTADQRCFQKDRPFFLKMLASARIHSTHGGI